MKGLYLGRVISDKFCCHSKCLAVELNKLFIKILARN